MRERGLKCLLWMFAAFADKVAPHAGAWIEIAFEPHQSTADTVAPHAGAWIEIIC